MTGASIAPVLGEDRPDDAAVPVTLALVVDGRGIRVIAERGEQLLAPLRRAGLRLAAICGGKGACGTCRVHVAEAWRDRLEEPLKRELRLLAHVGAGEGDRLSCRILIAPHHDGLEIYECIGKGDK